MDKFIVRFSILALNAYILVVIKFASKGIDISVYDFIFTDSVLFGIVLTVLCHTQGQYHCVWMRALCYNLIFIPSVNYINAKYYIFNSEDEYIDFIYKSMYVSIVFTIILAINHFLKVIKLKKKRNNYGIEQRRKGEIRQSFSRNEVSRNIHDGCDKSRDIRQM